MVRFLLQRPIAVLTSLAVFLVFGYVAFRNIPVSLLPDIDVPQIVVKINYPNTAAAAIEENIVRPIRENLATLKNLKDIESISSNHTGSLQLTFEYGTRMDLAYIEVNEKLDRVTNSLPKDLQRPQVIRINTSDIPIIRLQIIPQRIEEHLAVSELTEKVIKKRIEQIDGVSLVDINGKQTTVIVITPNNEKLQAFGLTEQEIAKVLQQSNSELGSLSVKDGYYKYFVKLANRLESVANIKQLPIHTNNNSFVLLGELATVEQVPEQVTGFHLFNGQQGLVLTVHKQARSRMNELVPKIKEAIEIFKKEYPQVNFYLTQDQTYILNAGIDNLNQDLIYGGILCVALLFMFLGNYASPTLMSISIPTSLIITFIFFYLFDISFNIISLSGLALGIGMLIDNSIVVLDNITRKRRAGLSMEESCVSGTNEVIIPVVSQVLTTVAVYVPLVYLNGQAGALVFDQAIALTISLSVSLLIAFCLNPVLYKLFLRQDPEKLKEDTIFYKWVSNGYHRMIEGVFKRKRVYFIITLLLMPIGFVIAYYVPISNLPAIEQTDGMVKLDWYASIDAEENKKRIDELASIFDITNNWEADIGVQQFLMLQENSAIQQATLYYQAQSLEQRREIEMRLKDFVKKKYPSATCKTEDAPNAFTQLFQDRSPYFEVRFSLNGKDNKESLEKFKNKIVSYLPDSGNGLGYIEEQNIEMTIDNDKLALYNITMSEVKDCLQRLFSSFTITEIRRFGEIKSVQFKSASTDMDHKMQSLIKNKDGAYYPLHSFAQYAYSAESKYITADRSGVYKSIQLSENNLDNAELIQEQINREAFEQGITVNYAGRYFQSQKLIWEMLIIFLISIMLLYFILAVQFENLVHPFIVMLTMPLGVAGAMFILLVSGGTLDIMAAMGFVVVLGIIVDDPILKVETINRLRNEYKATGSKREVLKRAIHEAGEICLKPLLMTSLTTSLALVPILFTGGIGSDLQKPLVWVIVGGLTIGTFFTLWFVPVAYWFITKKD